MDFTTKANTSGIGSFESCITIASACNLIFRKMFLDNETIGIIPPHGYRPSDKQSVMAYQWLYFLAHAKQMNIQHGRNKGEKHIGPYKADGYCEPGTERIVFAFGTVSLVCISRTTISPVAQLTMEDLYAQTIDLESEGYTYVSIWECQLKKELESKSAMKQYIQTLVDLVPLLAPTGAFYGGRTEAFKLYEEASIEKQLKYYDVISLYPSINKTGKIPLGHPEIITENFDSVDSFRYIIRSEKKVGQLLG